MNIIDEINGAVEKYGSIRVRNPATTELHSRITKATSFLPVSVKIRERIYCITTGISEILTCKSCDNTVSFKGPQYGYAEFCSSKCSNSSEATRAKVRATNIARLGVDVPAKSKHVTTKIKNTNLARYGVKCTQQNQTIKSKSIQSMQHRFGCDHYTQTPDILEQRTSSYLRLYGVEHPRQLNMADGVLSQLSNGDWLKNEHHTQQKTPHQIAGELGTTFSTVCRWLDNNQIERIDHPHSGRSVGECQLVEFIESVCGSHIITSDRTIIAPKELDVVLPDLKIAIEYCGLYWHSDCHERISKTYHSDKMNACSEAGYRLITIFEDEWLHRRDVVEAKLRHILGVSVESRVYARQCNIRTVTTVQDKREFFNANHIQGYGPGSVTYALTHNGVDVAMVSYISKRNGVFELNRYATSAVVVGGFSRLLKHFIKNNECSSILTHADKRWSDGGVYFKSGFNCIRESDPGYWYIKQTYRIHRQQFMKKNLHKVLSDFDPNETEFENCDRHGIRRIWDCGQYTFEMVL